MNIHTLMTIHITHMTIIYCDNIPISQSLPGINYASFIFSNRHSLMASLPFGDPSGRFASHTEAEQHSFGREPDGVTDAIRILTTTFYRCSFSEYQ